MTLEEQKDLIVRLQADLPDDRDGLREIWKTLNAAIHLRQSLTVLGVQTETRPAAPRRTREEIEWTAKDGFAGVTDEHMERWRKAYPAVNLNRAIAAANEWLIANPKKSKKSAGRFLVNWLARQQERGGDIDSKKPGQVHKGVDRDGPKKSRYL